MFIIAQMTADGGEAVSFSDPTTFTIYRVLCGAASEAEGI